MVWTCIRIIQGAQSSLVYAECSYIKCFSIQTFALDVKLSTWMESCFGPMFPVKFKFLIVWPIQTSNKYDYISEVAIKNLLTKVVNASLPWQHTIKGTRKLLWMLTSNVVITWNCEKISLLMPSSQNWVLCTKQYLYSKKQLNCLKIKFLAVPSIFYLIQDSIPFFS